MLHIFIVVYVIGGLVQRANTGSNSSGSGTTYEPPGAEGCIDQPEQDYEDDGGDSKAVRMTLMEEVLLLGLKDREVNVLCTVHHNYTLDYMYIILTN